jgi:hypothetical protein
MPHVLPGIEASALSKDPDDGVTRDSLDKSSVACLPSSITDLAYEQKISDNKE